MQLAVGQEISSPLKFPDLLWKHKYEILIIASALVSVGIAEVYPLQVIASTSNLGDTPVDLDGVQDGIGISMPKAPSGPGVHPEVKVISVPLSKIDSSEAVSTTFRGITVDPKTVVQTTPKVEATPPALVFKSVVKADESVSVRATNILKNKPEKSIILMPTDQNELRTLVRALVSEIVIGENQQYYARAVTYLDGNLRGLLVKFDEVQDVNSLTVNMGVDNITKLFNLRKLSNVTDPYNDYGLSILRVNVGRNISNAKGYILNGRSVILNSTNDPSLMDINNPEMAIDAVLSAYLVGK